MARTHDLFAGGIDRVPLVELVEQMIPSLSVVKPPGVDIRTDLATVHVLLRTERAVSLAMVLHELCSNAILHGTGSTGTVAIRATMQRPEMKPGSIKGIMTVNLEVIDAGRATAIDKPGEIQRVGSGGLGLILVDGLVTRELGGTFSLVPLKDGGSVARVQFPVGENEMETKGRQ